MSNETEKKILRREMLSGSVKVGLMMAGASFLAACGKSGPATLSCNDTVGMKPDDIANRKTLEYVDKSADPAKTCTGCQQFQPAAPNQCGTCKVLKGPVNPGGNCKSFLARTA